ncbi:unnamed protein product, partial [Meganyctiphanes norvegica]
MSIFWQLTRSFLLPIMKCKNHHQTEKLYTNESGVAIPSKMERNIIKGQTCLKYTSVHILKKEDTLKSVYPEFLPDPTPQWRNKLREKLERQDMLARRAVMPIPEFYVGGFMKCSMNPTNPYGKSNYFGVCDRGGGSLKKGYFLWKMSENGVEILYEMYCPLITSIETLRLEKRMDEELLYLRDSLPEYSTFPLDMDPEPLQEGATVPINQLKVKLKPRPWHSRWERFNLQGVQDLELPTKFIERAKTFEKPWEKYDLMKDYRETISEEEQRDIFLEVSSSYPQMEAARRRIKRTRT